MIAIDYPDLQPPSGHRHAPLQTGSYRRNVVTSMCEGYNLRVGNHAGPSHGGADVDMDYPSYQGGAYPRHAPHEEYNQVNLNTPSARSSRSSEASSGVSSWDCGHVPFEHPDLDFSGLPENAVDSDDEDDESVPSGDSCSLWEALHDTVRECLEKDVEERTDDDLSILVEFMQRMPSFAHLPQSVKRALCAKMVFAVVPEAGRVVMEDGELLDSWCVIVNGEVEVLKPDGTRTEYHLGDWFGVEPKPTPQRHKGVMRTVVDDCNFVLVAQEAYVQIMERLQDNVRKNLDSAGLVVSETERRTYDNGAREGYVYMKARSDKLIELLVEDYDKAVDPYFIEDVLLMHRTFVKDSTDIMDKLMTWFRDPQYRDKVVRVILLWVNNHFNDFETSTKMMKSLEQFESLLDQENLYEAEKLLHIACSVKSRAKTLTYTRSDRDEMLHFSILGGFEKGHGIYVSNVASGSQADKVGLKRGDQILEVNGQNFQHVPHRKALEILRGSTHVSITVKSNLLGFKEMEATPDKNELLRKKRSEVVCVQVPREPPSGNPLPTVARCEGKLQKLKRRLKQASQSASTIHAEDLVDSSSQGRASLHALTEVPGSPPVTNRLRPSQSNPDLSNGASPGGSIAQYYQPVKSAFPEHVLKIYRANQTFKYLTVYKETTAQNVVQLALQEFGMATTEQSSNYGLYEVTVTEQGVIKQKRLPDQMQNLAERISLNSRYYLRNVLSSEPLLVDEHAPEVAREAHTHLIQLNATIVAAQLTLQDFAVFAAIEPTEYVDDVFGTKSVYGTPKLREFEEIVNKETFWVCTEICQEKAILKRAKLLKKFIKIAKFCKDFKNLNSMFAVLSGLEHVSVRRLNQTWEKVSARHRKTFDELQHLLNPSRNMSVYRGYLDHHVKHFPPAIPMFPVLKKDLTVQHEVKDTICDNGLVNFDKLRVISQEVPFSVQHEVKDTICDNGLVNFDKLRVISQEVPFSVQHEVKDTICDNGLVNFDKLRVISQEVPFSVQHEVKDTICDNGLVNFDKLRVISQEVPFSVQHEVKDTICDNGLVNFDKLRVISQEVRNANNLASAPFELNSMMSEKTGAALLHMNSFDGQNVATVRRPQARNGPVNRKKLYEQALMIRRVKSYLSTLNVVSDESVLDTMSAECEPPAPHSNSSSHLPSAHSSGSATVGMRRRHPSPSPSANSANSCASAPPTVKDTILGHSKLMSLAESSRVRPRDLPHPKHPQGSPSRNHRHSSPPTHSPVPPRRGARHRHHGDVHHPPGPVDLTTESSAVTNLLTATRLPSSVSVASTDSAFSQIAISGVAPGIQAGSMVHATSSDSTDSGHASIDAYSGSSPPTQRRSFPPQQKDAVNKEINRVMYPSSRKMVRAPVPPADRHRVKNLSSRYPAEDDAEQVSRV